VDINALYILPVLSHDEDPLRAFINGLTDVLRLLPDIDVTVMEGGDPEEPLDPLVDELYEATVPQEGAAPGDGKDGKTRVVILQGLGDILAGLTEDNRYRFRELLDKGRASSKVHFVLADTAAQLYNNYVGDDWYRTHITGDGIWVGDGLMMGQYVLKTNTSSSELNAEIGDKFGYYINRGRPVLCKLVSAD